MIFKSGPILESKGRFFRKRAKKEGKKKKKLKTRKKWQNIGKFGQKCTKFENILKSAGDCMWL